MGHWALSIPKFLGHRALDILRRLGHWALGFGHSLVIGHWALGIPPVIRPGLKGQNNTAQGNALGIAVPDPPALKGRDNTSTTGSGGSSKHIPPLQGLFSEGGIIPRALPWALLKLPLWGGQPGHPKAAPSGVVNWARLRRWLVGLAVGLAVMAQLPNAAGADKAIYQEKANKIRDLALYSKWPPEASPPKKGEFVFGILGDNPFGQSINVLKTQLIQGQRVVVKEFASVEQVTNCHMLFISISEKKKMEHILERLEGRSVLTISEEEKNGFKGIFNFVLEEAEGFGNWKVRWNIDDQAAKKAGLQIHVAFYRLALK